MRIDCRLAHFLVQSLECFRMVFVISASVLWSLLILGFGPRGHRMFPTSGRRARVMGIWSTLSDWFVDWLAWGG